MNFSVLDLGIANIGSVINICKIIGVKLDVVTTNDQIINSDFLIIPGVGSFDRAMNKIHELNILSSLNFIANHKKIPILGICLGMQIMTKNSEEGSLQGLGWIDANVIRFNPDYSARIPHMGWNTLHNINNNKIFNNHFNEWSFYFVHSYFVYCSTKSNILTTTSYGNSFVSSFLSDNLLGVQFHPEKSHIFGKAFFSNIFNYFKIH